MHKNADILLNRKIINLGKEFTSEKKVCQLTRVIQNQTLA